MTNYHVMESVILGEQGKCTSKGEWALPKDVTFRFDYKRLADGTTINPGTTFDLHDDSWLIDFSSYAINTELPQLDELDYALI